MSSKMDITIILLHGLGSIPLTMIGIKNYLHYQGFDTIHNLSYPVDKLKLNESVSHINDQLEKLISKNDRIIIIGQSAGGVIGSLLHIFGWNIELLITIGSPLKGASLLRSLKNNIPESLQKILHKPMYDDLLQLLSQPISEPPHKCHCITMGWFYTEFDGCVYAEEAYFTKDSHTHIYFADHRVVFADPRLWDTVYKRILDCLSETKNS